MNCPQFCSSLPSSTAFGSFPLPAHLCGSCQMWHRTRHAAWQTGVCQKEAWPVVEKTKLSLKSVQHPSAELRAKTANCTFVYCCCPTLEGMCNASLDDWPSGGSLEVYAPQVGSIASSALHSLIVLKRSLFNIFLTASCPRAIDFRTRVLILLGGWCWCLQGVPI